MAAANGKRLRGAAIFITRLRVGAFGEQKFSELSMATQGRHVKRGASNDVAHIHVSAGIQQIRHLLLMAAQCRLMQRHGSRCDPGRGGRNSLDRVRGRRTHHLLGCLT